MSDEYKHCAGNEGCRYCGMDMDMEPFCVNENVLKLRTEITGREYPFGLDVNPARQLCQGNHWESRK